MSCSFHPFLFYFWAFPYILEILTCSNTMILKIGLDWWVTFLVRLHQLVQKLVEWESDPLNWWSNQWIGRTGQFHSNRMVQLIFLKKFYLSKWRCFGGYKNTLTPHSPFESKVNKLPPPTCRDTHASSHRRSPRSLHCLPGPKPAAPPLPTLPRWSKRPSRKLVCVHILTPPSSYKLIFSNLFFMFYI